MTDRPHHMGTLAAIQEGMASTERGELKPAAQVLDGMGPTKAYRISLPAPPDDAYAAFERFREAGRCTRKWLMRFGKASRWYPS